MTPEYIEVIFWQAQQTARANAGPDSFVRYHGGLPDSAEARSSDMLVHIAMARKMCAEGDTFRTALMIARKIVLAEAETELPGSFADRTARELGDAIDRYCYERRTR